MSPALVIPGLDDEFSPPTKGKKKPGFRKAPQAPRRFRSAYILFSISQMEEYKKSKAKHVQVTSFSSQIAQDWKKLPAEERKKWEQEALRDKERYNAEKELYKGPWQIPTGRSRKVRPVICSWDSSAQKYPFSKTPHPFLSRIPMLRNVLHLPSCSTARP